MGQLSDWEKNLWEAAVPHYPEGAKMRLWAFRKAISWFRYHVNRCCYYYYYCLVFRLCHNPALHRGSSVKWVLYPKQHIDPLVMSDATGEPSQFLQLLCPECGVGSLIFSWRRSLCQGVWHLQRFWGMKGQEGPKDHVQQIKGDQGQGQLEMHLPMQPVLTQIVLQFVQSDCRIL